MIYGQKVLTFKICLQGKTTGSEIAPGYYFPQIFSENNNSLNHNHKTAIRTFFTNFNNLTCGKDKFVFEGIESVQCGTAYRTNSLLFSLGTRDSFLGQQIPGDYVFGETTKKDVKIDNAAKKEHVDIHWLKLNRKIYEPNPKHKADYGWGSIMDLEEKEAQYVLDRAIMADKDEKHLIARYHDVYYSFRCHWRNFYHGYQDNSMPKAPQGTSSALRGFWHFDSIPYGTPGGLHTSSDTLPLRYSAIPAISHPLINRVWLHAGIGVLNFCGLPFIASRIF